MDRGQLILISGLTLAVTLLILVLLLNTAIYTENVATRGIDSDIGDAAEFQQTLDAEIRAILENQAPGDENDVHQNVTADIDVLLAQQANTSIERGHIAVAEILHIETEQHGEQYVVTAVEFDLTFISSEVHYETKRTVQGEET